MIMTEDRKTAAVSVGGITAFLDYVGVLPHRWVLDNLISGASDASRRIVSSAMIKEAVAGFVARASLVRRFGALPPELRLRCAQVYLMGSVGLSLPADPAAYRREPLLTSLLVFAAQAGAGTGVARLFGFGEFEPALRALMASELLGAGDAGECSVPPPAACPWRPLNDAAAVCSFAAQGRLARNVHGGIARSALNSLKRVVHDPTLSGRGVPDGAPGHPSGFLIGYCLKEALIIDAGAEYALNRQGLSNWLDRSMRDRLNRLNAYAEEFLDGAGLCLARELLCRAEGRVIAVNRLLPESDRPAFARAVGVLEFLGRVHVWHSHGGVRFTPCQPVDGDADTLYAKEPKRDILIMPDFSVIIPQEVSPSELFDFSRIGMLCAFDKVYCGHITKESVSNALSAGVDAGQLRGWLRGRNAAANVVSTVDEWVREFGRLYVSRGAVLASGDETVTRQLAALDALRKHLTEVKAHTVFMINPGSERKVLDILEKLGFDTRAPGGQAAHVSVAKAEAAAPADGAADAREPNAFGGARRLTLLTDFDADRKPPPPQASVMIRTKYGSGLKALEQSDMMHVVDYAMLTNQALVIDYDGSAYIKRDIYTVVPLGLDKGIDAAVEAEIPFVRGRKQFYLDKIKRIAVVAR
jgi:hypothetical protein